MRERSTIEPESIVTFEMLGKYVPTGAITDWGDTFWRWCPGLEVIRDEPKTRYVAYGPKVRRKCFKTCTHDKWRVTDRSSPVWVNSTTDGKYQERVRGTSLLENVFWNAAGPHPSGVSLGATAYSRALSKALAEDYGHYNRWGMLKPTMATRANLSVFLYELREFSRMWDFIPKKHLLLKGLVQRTLTWGTFRKWRAAYDGNPTAFFKYLNDQHLNYNFGWKPFISDIRKCWRGLESFEKRLHRFQRDAGKELRKRFRDTPRHVSETLTTTSSTISRYQIVETWDFDEQHASAFDFSYSIPQYSNEELRWRALADTLGAKITPLTFWALGPWTFVADWFLNVSGYLESLESDWLQPWVKLHQGCYSRAISGTYRADTRNTSPYGGAQIPGITLDFSQYIRKVGLPNFSAATDPLDADKIRLGSSLLLSLFMR